MMKADAYTYIARTTHIVQDYSSVGQLLGAQVACHLSTTWQWPFISFFRKIFYFIFRSIFHTICITHDILQPRTRTHNTGVRRRYCLAKLHKLNIIFLLYFVAGFEYNFHAIQHTFDCRPEDLIRIAISQLLNGAYLFDQCLFLTDNSEWNILRKNIYRIYKHFHCTMLSKFTTVNSLHITLNEIWSIGTYFPICYFWPSTPVDLGLGIHYEYKVYVVCTIKNVLNVAKVTTEISW